MVRGCKIKSEGTKYLCIDNKGFLVKVSKEDLVNYCKPGGNWVSLSDYSNLLNAVLGVIDYLFPYVGIKSVIILKVEVINNVVNLAYSYGKGFNDEVSFGDKGIVDSNVITLVSAMSGYKCVYYFIEANKIGVYK